MADEAKADRAYRAIEHMIVFQDVAPGTLVSEADLMERTGLGRTPVREALQRLARNRMVEIYPSRGVLVPPTSVDDQLKRLELRRVLEALAVRLACERLRPAQRLAMQDLLRDLNSASGLELPEYAETIKRTHHLIAASANNAYLADALAPVQGLSRRFWIAHVVDERAEIENGARCHIEIVMAILANSPDDAEQASLDLNDYLVAFAHHVLGTNPARLEA